MKRNRLTIAIGAVLLLIFIALLFFFQVRKSEVAIVTTFGKPVATYKEPGLYFKLPWPIQKVHRLDHRVQNFDGKFEDLITSDYFNLMVMTYVGWRIHDIRRTSRTLLSRAKVDSDIAEKCLGHLPAGLRQTYDQHKYQSELAHAFAALAALIARIGLRDAVVVIHKAALTRIVRNG